MATLTQNPAFFVMRAPALRRFCATERVGGARVAA